jgi:hypothetical protein
MRSKNDPHFFEKAQCSECREFGVELMKHKFSDVLTCVECVNDELRKLEEEEDWGDENEALTLEQRNA